MASVGTISGLSSGIQWRDMVDQIMALESQRVLSPLTARQKQLTTAAAAWTEFQGVVGRFRDASTKVRDGGTFDVFTTSASKSAGGHDLVSVSTGATAGPGSYGVEVINLATAEKLSGTAVASASTALNVTGRFAVNGQAVTVVATDTLATLRDKINAANTGLSASGVSAVVMGGASSSRLVLTSNQTGAAGIELTDLSTDLPTETLHSLGFVDGTATANIAPGGVTRTHRFSVSTTAIATLLGIPMPTPSTIKVGGRSISVDLNIDSLATIAARINIAAGDGSAEVIAESLGGKTQYRLQTSLAIESTGSSDSAQNLAVLGFTTMGRSGEAQVVKSANAFGDALGGSASTSTLLSDLQVSGQGLGIANGDSLTINGVRGDGTTFTRIYSVTDTTTMAELRAEAVAGFGTGRTAGLEIEGGRFVFTDNTAGDSQLGVSITVAKSGGGGTISLGEFSTDSGAVGRSRLINSGADAKLRVDNQVVTSASNMVTAAISGVTLNLLAAEVGSTVNVTVSRDLDGVLAGLNEMVSTYNAVRSFVSTNTATGGRLAGQAGLRSMVLSITNAIQQSVSGLSGTVFSNAAVAGVTHSAAGVLSIDAATLKGFLQTNLEDIRTLFSLRGTPSDPNVAFVSAGAATKAGAAYSIEISSIATLASQTGNVLASYVKDGAPDTMTITDSSTAYTGSIQLTGGDTLATIVANLNALFTTKKMQLVASATIAGQVKIDALGYGTGGGFTVGYTPGTGGDGTALLGISEGLHVGFDVAGQINGVTATGSGQILSGATGDDTAGLNIRYSGTTAGDAGTIRFTLGLAGAVQRIADDIARTGDGRAENLAALSTASAAALDSRINSASARLDTRRAALIRQFTAMEIAMAKAQALSASLTATINSFSSNNRN